MRPEPGFVTELRDELSQLSDDIIGYVNRPGGLLLHDLLALVATAEAAPFTFVEDASEAAVVAGPELRVPYIERGVDSLVAGKVALCLLAGGSGTRVGEPKFMLRLPNLGLSLLALKMVQSIVIHPALGRGLALPTWVMVNPASQQFVEEHLKELMFWEPDRIKLFGQYESLRLTPDNRLARDDNNQPQLYPTGHGDLPNALVDSGLLDTNPNIEHIVVTNVDNVMSPVDPGIIGLHEAMGAPVTCLVVRRRQSDEGGVIAWANGNLQVVEDVLLPESFDGSRATWHNTNTMIISIEAIRRAAKTSWRWVRVRKTPNNRLVIQYERLLGQLTEFVEANFIEVLHEEFYMPVKSQLGLSQADYLLSGGGCGHIR